MLLSISRRINLPLLALFVILLLFNIPYWQKEFMVGHDTRNMYLLYHFFYNHVHWYSELPQWLPYGEYGHRSLFLQIVTTSPAAYLTGAIGLLLRMKDTLLLFKLSVFGDQLIFLLGLHLLSGQLYRERLTRFIICLLGIGSVVWNWQLYWGLHLYYLLPLTLYFYFRFFTGSGGWQLWAAVLTTMFTIMGGLPYWIPVFIYLCLVMTLIMAPRQWRVFATLLKPDRRNLALMIVTLVFGVALGYLLLTCLEGLHNYSPGRALSGMHTDLRTFLSYCAPGWKYLHAFFDGTFPDPSPLTKYSDDIYLYIGLVPLVATAAALGKVSDRRFYALFGGFIALLLLAGGGSSSWLLYWLVPLMKTFRHVGLLLELGKILLLLAAGFGIDLLLERLRIPGWLERRATPFALLAALAGLFFILDLVVTQMVPRNDSWSSPMHFTAMLPPGGAWIVLRLLWYALLLCCCFVLVRLPSWRCFLTPKALSLALLSVCVVDIFCFQGFYWTNRMQGKYAGSFVLEQLSFQPERLKGIKQLTQLRRDLIIKSTEGTYLGYNANLLQYDPCVPMGQVDLLSQGVHELVKARGGNPTQAMERYFGAQNVVPPFLPAGDSQLLTVMGCEAPKVRFVTQAQYGSTNREINGMLITSSNVDSTVILKGGPERQLVGAPLNDPQAMSYQPRFFNANRLDLDVSVKPGYTGWLVYADAFDPYWKAYIDGQETPVQEAYRAFKAIAISGGVSKVSFRYENTWQRRAMVFLIAMSIMGTLGCIVALGWQLGKGREEF